MIQASGSTLINTTYTSDGTRQGIVTALSAALQSAGWNVVSGGGTADVLLSSATTPQGASCRVRLLDSGSGNCAQVTFKNAAGTAVSNIAYLLPTSGRVFRIVANKYQFFFFSTGTTTITTARETVMGGVLFLPAFMVSYLAGSLEHWWMHYTGNTDTDTTARNNFRSTLVLYSSTGLCGSAMMQGTVTNYGTANGFNCPSVRNLTTSSSSSSWQTAALWLDGSLPIGDATMTWGANNATTPVYTRGVMWDAFVLIGASLSTEATVTGPDGDTYMVLTHNASPQLLVRVA